MNIKHIEMSAHPGGLTKLMVVVDGDRTLIGDAVSKAQSDLDKYELEIHRVKSKRGLTANAYYWVLAEKLSKAMESSKDDIHEQMMQRYGTIKTNQDGRPIVFSLAAGEDPKSVTPYSRAFAEGYVNGKRFVHYAVLKESHLMSSKEFGELLDGLISECKEVGGIETMTPAQVAELEYLDSHSTNYKEKQ